jgi:hypothetical protein
MAVYGGPDIVTDGLVLHLDAANDKSYPGSGTTWFDLSANTNNGNILGALYNESNSGSLVFDGINDYVSLLSSFLPNELFADASGQWTVSCWFKFPVSPVGSRANIIANQSWSLIGRAGGIATQGHFILFVGSETNTQYGQYAPYKLACTIRGAVTVISEFSVNTNTYNYVALTWDGSSGSVYFNEEPPKNMSVGGASKQIYSNFYIGSNIAIPSNHYYSGNIAQVSIYNSALSSQKIQQNYNALKGRFGL